MSSVDDAFQAAQHLNTDEKLILIARLEESISPNGEFRPSDADLEEVKRRWADFEAGKTKAQPWDKVWSEVEREFNDAES